MRKITKFLDYLVICSPVVYSIVAIGSFAKGETIAGVLWLILSTLWLIYYKLASFVDGGEDD